MPIFYLVSFFAVFIWSLIQPYDYFTWFLEVIPALIYAVVLIALFKNHRPTPLLLGLIWVHCLILMVGGHYTYARVPLFDWLKEVMDWQRNNYDKVGHLAQGFIPAIIAREVLLRLNVLKDRRWLAPICTCICLAISAAYELVEWGVAVMTGEGAEDFLGTQGYVWDTQSDMGLALLGAVLALALLSRAHDRQLAQIKA
jgi:putative membrane protein